MTVRVTYEVPGPFTFKMNAAEAYAMDGKIVVSVDNPNYIYIIDGPYALCISGQEITITKLEHFDDSILVYHDPGIIVDIKVKR